MARFSQRWLAPSCVAAAVLAVVLPAAAQSKPDAVQVLWNYAGVWKVNTQHFDTPYSKASQESSTLMNDCWKTGQYVACRQVVNGESKVMLVFTCANAHECTSYQIPTDGGAPGSGKLIIDGDTWTFPWSSTEHGKTTWFRVVNVWSTHDSIEFRQEYSTDEKHWVAMASGHETRMDIHRMPVDPVTHP